jgi:outer membrane protein TolC
LTEAAQAYAQGAGALPNPELRLSAVAGDADENSNSLSQTLEIAGQPRLRRKTAEEAALASAATEEALRREIELETVETYYRLWERAALDNLARLQLELARELQGTALKRLQFGEISTSEHFRSQLLTAQAEANQAEAESDLQIAQQTLALLLATDAPVVLPLIPGDLPVAPAFALPKNFEALAVRQDNALSRPELEAARREANSSELEAELAARAGAPDLQLSAYRGTLGHAPEQGVQLSLVIPLFDWGQLGANHARQAKLAEARRYDVEILQRQVQAELGTARAQYEAAFKKRQAMADQAARHLFLSKTAQQGYEVGLLSLVEVLDAQTAYRQGLQAYIEAEAGFHRSRLRLWWASGQSLSQVMENPTDPTRGRPDKVDAIRNDP